MRKSYPLIGQNHKPARVVDLIRSDIRKYIKRERKKALPEGVDFWDFNCKVGPTAEGAKDSHIASISKDLEAAVTDNWETAYIELVAKPAKRQKKS